MQLGTRQLRLISTLTWILGMILNSAESQAYSGYPIELSCKNTRAIHSPDAGDRAQNLDLEQLKSKYGDHTEIVEIANRMLQDHRGSSTYKKSAELLAKSMTDLSSHPEENACKKAKPLERTLGDLMKKYSTEASRAAHPQAYLADLENVLKASKSGLRVLRCFHGASDPTLFEPGYEYLSPEDASAQYHIHPAGTFNYLGLKSPGRKRVKTIIYDLSTPPLISLFLLAHEMQHACDGAEAAQNSDRLLKAKHEGAERLKAAREQFDQESVVLEARGYLAAEKVFSELSRAAPEVLCHQAYVSDFFKGEVVTLADYYAYIQNTIQSGEFSRAQALNYVGDGMYSFDSIFNKKGKSNEVTLKDPVKTQVILGVSRAEAEF